MPTLITTLEISNNGLFMLCEIKYNCSPYYDFTKHLNLDEEMRGDMIVDKLQEDLTDCINRCRYNNIEDLIDDAVREYSEYYLLSESDMESQDESF